MADFTHEKYQNQTDEWATPRTLTRPLADAVGGFDLDPASGAEDEPHADVQFTAEDDGLRQDWFGKVFCNPPFSDKDDWLKKAVQEVDDGDAELVVMVLPVDTSTRWYHDYVTQATAVCFMGPGRVDFERRSNATNSGSPNFATMLAVFGDVQTPQLLGVLNERGIVYYHRGLYRETRQTTLAGTR